MSVLQFLNAYKFAELDSGILTMLGSAWRLVAVSLMLTAVRGLIVAAFRWFR